MNIRLAKRKDITEIISLCGEHASFEKAVFDPKNKAELFSKHLIDRDEGIQCLVVEAHGVLIGYASFMKQFSTWDASYYVYLDCLFLKKEFRGTGIGSKMMARIKAYAQAENCQIVQWQTPSFNESAIKFYERIGATSKTKERFFWEI